MQPNKSSRRFHILLILLGIGFTVLIVLLLLKPKEVAVEIFTVPSDAQVTMDGKPIKAGDTTILSGKHTFVATRQYFKTVIVEMDTKDLNDAKTVYLALYPEGAEGKAYLAAHPDEQLRYERISGADFSALQEKIYNDFPVTADLPYQTTDFKIDYDITKEGQNLVYLVSLYPIAAAPGSDLYKQQLVQYRDEALAWLASKGVDTSTADIRYAPDPDGL